MSGHSNRTPLVLLTFAFDEMPAVSGEPASSPATETYATLRQLLTPKRIEILREIESSSPESITALAESVERSYPTVHDDVAILEDAGLLTLQEGASRGSKPVLSHSLQQFVAPAEASTDELPVAREPTSEHATPGPDSSEPVQPGGDELAAWLDSDQHLEQLVGYERGDVVWSGPADGGCALVILSHSLPEGTSTLSGIPLLLKIEGTSDMDRLDPEVWETGGPGVAVASRPWETRAIEESAIEGRLGALSTSAVNSLSIRMQVFVGPARS